MAIPRKVQEQANRAEEIRKKIYEEGKTPEEAGAAPAPKGSTEPPIPPAATPPETPAPPATDYKAMYEEMKQKHDTLKGKFDSEVPELISNNKFMASEIANLKGQMSEIFSRTTPKPTETPPDPSETEDFKNYRDNYPEIYRGVELQCRKLVREEVDKIRSELAPRIESTEKKVERSAEEIFGERMDRLVKDQNGVSCWRRLNDDPNFTAWLKREKDRRTGFGFFDLLRAALARNDFDTVANFFNDYLRMTGELKETPPPPPPEPEKGKDGKPIEGKGKEAGSENIAPPKPGAGGSPPPPPEDHQVKTITQAFVKAFYKDVALGKYKHRPKDRDKIEAQINDAMLKGLIQRV